jgi:hypothetical protein
MRTLVAVSLIRAASLKSRKRCAATTGLVTLR